MATTTPVLGLLKPVVGADDDLWGGFLNQNMDVLDAQVVTRGSGVAIVGTDPTSTVYEPLWWDSNSGQLFVQYDDGSSVQWVSANSIDASTLEGSFLPLTGGTMQGPLNYTATGGTVARSAQDRSADVVNVLDKGADPTGVADSSDAINAALAVVAPGPDGKHKSAYLPAGMYRVNKQITLTSSQALFGDSRGSSRLYVDDRFDPAASSVILCRAGFQDAGPTLRDFGITFAQPSDQGSRANFKTLAAGGTSATGGTGVRYPWAIAAGDDGFRTQIVRVRIGGAWDGITSNNHNAVFWLDDVEMGALDCGVSLGEGASGGIQDFTHVSGYHFWNFDLGGSLWNVFNDGTTTGMRVGRVDSFDVRDLSMFCARLIFTADANNFTFCHIVNCQLDGDPSGIEINGQMRHLGISNLYGGSGTTRVRPFVSVNARCNLQISNYSAFSSSNYPDFVVNDFDADVTLSNFHAQFFTDNIRWVDVQRGVMRIVNGFLYLNGPRTVSAIAETFNGNLIVDNVTVQALTPSGPLVSVVTSGEWSMIGRLSVQNSSAWTYALPSGLTQRFFSPRTDFNNGSVAMGNLFVSGVPSDTVAQLTLAGFGGANGLESKLRFFGTFPVSADNTEYMAASLRSGWTSAVWDSSYLDVWLTNAGNGGGSDAATVRVAEFTPAAVQVGTASHVVDMKVVGPSGTQKNYYLCRGANIAWGVSSRDATDDFAVLRFNDSSGFLGNSFLISRANGRPSFPEMPASTTYANDGAAATGGVPVGGIYRNGSVLQIRVA